MLEQHLHVNFGMDNLFTVITPRVSSEAITEMEAWRLFFFPAVLAHYQYMHNKTTQTESSLLISHLYILKNLSWYAF